jgi:hypothetical protein
MPLNAPQVEIRLHLLCTDQPDEFPLKQSCINSLNGIEPRKALVINFPKFSLNRDARSCDIFTPASTRHGKAPQLKSR